MTRRVLLRASRTEASELSHLGAVPSPPPAFTRSCRPVRKWPFCYPVCRGPGSGPGIVVPGQRAGLIERAPVERSTTGHTIRQSPVDVSSRGGRRGRGAIVPGASGLSSGARSSVVRRPGEQGGASGPAAKGRPTAGPPHTWRRGRRGGLGRWGRKVHRGRKTARRSTRGSASAASPRIDSSTRSIRFVRGVSCLPRASNGVELVVPGGMRR